VAHSEPEEIEGLDLLAELEALSSNERRHDLSNSQFIQKTVQTTEGSLINSDQKKLYAAILADRMVDTQQELPDSIEGLIKLSTYTFVTGVNIYFGI
jgi:hypothetical protein